MLIDNLHNSPIIVLMFLSKLDNPAMKEMSKGQKEETFSRDRARRNQQERETNVPDKPG